MTTLAELVEPRVFGVRGGRPGRTVVGGARGGAGVAEHDPAVGGEGRAGAAGAAGAAGGRRRGTVGRRVRSWRNLGGIQLLPSLP